MLLNHRERKCVDNYIFNKGHNEFIFKTAVSILVTSIHNSFQVLFDKIASVYFIWKKYINILALEMASPGNQHCASCIGTPSFTVTEPEDIISGWLQVCRLHNS